MSLCLQFYFVVPFDLENARQYVLRSVIICLRCSTAVAIFGVNGLVDVLAGLLMPLFVVFLILRKTRFNTGSIGLTIPAVLVTILGCSIFNFIILEEQRRLYSNEIVQRSKQEEMMKIVDMFHGTVFIVEPNTNTILFEKKVTEAKFNILTKTGDEIREDRIY